jgi:hypothetical protein
LNKLEFPLPKDSLYHVWLNLACWFWRRRFLKNFSAFSIFTIISPLRGAISFIRTNMNPLHPRMICAKSV